MRDAAAARPAYDTKDTKLLSFHFKLAGAEEVDLELEQSQDPSANTTGTTLWLGGQVLSAFLLSLHIDRCKSGRTDSSRPRCVDLGAGVGLLSLVLAACKYTVIATDLPILVQDGLLSKNIARNKAHDGRLQLSCEVLDWLGDPSAWDASLLEPFELIVSSDSIYVPELVKPLLYTMYRLASRSYTRSGKAPDIYIAYEHRDDVQYLLFTQSAQSMGFKLKKIPAAKLRKAVTAAFGWSASEHDGISVLHMKLV